MAHKVSAAVVAVLVLLGVVLFLPALPIPLIGPGEGLTPKEQSDAEATLRGHLLQALAGIVLGLGAYFTARTFALNREGQITERFTKAVEQLGDEKLDIRLGGIYALDRIAHDSETHHGPVVEVLTAFLREHALRERTPERGRRPSPGDPNPPPVTEPEDAPPDPWPVPLRLRDDVYAIAAVLAGRDTKHEPADLRLMLREVDLHGAHLVAANLIGADLFNADLSGARLIEAVLTGADLGSADLRGAALTGADLRSAYLSGARLTEASLTGANLGSADLSGANLAFASLTADFTRADLTGADFTHANLTGAWAQPRLGPEWGHLHRLQRHVLVRASTVAREREQTMVVQLGTAAIVERVIHLAGIERVLPRAHDRQEAVQIIQQQASGEGGPRTIGRWRGRQPGGSRARGG